MPRRAKLGAQGSAVYLSWATALECCHCGWACLGPTPQQCPVQQCDNHHSGSHYHTSITPFCGHLCWTFSWHCHVHQPAAPVSLGAAAVGFPHCLKPLSPCTVCKRESCHQWPWGLWLQVKKQRVPPNWMRRTQPSLPWRQALLRHLHGWSHQKMYPVSLMSATHHPHQPCQKPQRWPAPSPSHNSRLPQGLTQQNCQRRCFGCRAKWTWP